VSKLVLFVPDGTTVDIPLDHERVTIGRRAGNDVALPNLAVSGEHAVVVTILADSFLEDLNSTNGTLVNGDPVAKHFLRDRDEIDIGRHKLVYCLDDDAVPAPRRAEGRQRLMERDSGGRVEAAKPLAGKRVETPPTAPAAAAHQDPGPKAAPRAVEALIEPPEPLPEEPDAPAAVEAPARIDGPAVSIVSGARAGMAIALTKPETTLGRPGVQVAAILKVGPGFRLRPVEGISPPVLNGEPVAADGRDLKPGDLIEIAGTRVEFVDPSAQPVDENPGKE